MNIVLTFDNRNASIEPVGFRTVIQSVVDFFNGTYSDNVRINIDVGYGFVGRTVDRGARRGPRVLQL
jgi:F0F1-type ATP synthase membrane subunit a